MKPTPIAIGSAALIVAAAVLVYGQYRQQTALNLLSARLEKLETQHRRPEMDWYAKYLKPTATPAS